MVIVHVIPAEGTGGDRHEERFPDGTSDVQIMDALTKPREVVTRAGAQTLPAMQDSYGRLKGNIAYLADPRTIVSVGTVDRELSPQGDFIETRRLRGPSS